MPELSVAFAATTISSHDFSVEARMSFRPDMLRLARLQLRNSEAAEDMVQEAIEAALRHGSSFSGRSHLKAWVFAILKNRVFNYLRHARRTVSISSLMDDGDDWEEQLDKLFSPSALGRLLHQRVRGGRACSSGAYPSSRNACPRAW